MKVRENEIDFANVLENGDIASFLRIFCHILRDINVTFCYSVFKLESGKIIACQAKFRENENFKRMATLIILKNFVLKNLCYYMYC